ncbi:hypothetical protein D3C87_1192310 [compost metagenome]
MQRPAGLQGLGEVLAHGGAARADRLGDGDRSLGHPIGPDLGFDRAADELDDLVARSHEGQVDVAALDLGPVVPGIDTQARRILREGLMQHADDYQATFGAGSGFGEFLEEVDIVPGAEGGGFQELAHLVDDDQRTIMRSALGLIKKLCDQRLGVGFASAVDGFSLRAAKRRMQLRNDTSASTHRRDEQPTLADGEGLVERGHGVQAQNLTRLDSESLVGMERARQCHGQRALASTKGARPGKGALVGGRQLFAHAIDHGSCSSVADIAGQGICTADVSVDADRALILARNLDDVRQSLLLLVSHRRA